MRRERTYALLAAMVLVACGGDEEQAAPPAEPSAEQTSEDEPDGDEPTATEDDPDDDDDTAEGEAPEPDPSDEDADEDDEDREVAWESEYDEARFPLSYGRDGPVRAVTMIDGAPHVPLEAREPSGAPRFVSREAESRIWEADLADAPASGTPVRLFRQSDATHCDGRLGTARLIGVELGGWEAPDFFEDELGHDGDEPYVPSAPHYTVSWSAHAPVEGCRGRYSVAAVGLDPSAPGVRLARAPELERDAARRLRAAMGERGRLIPRRTRGWRAGDTRYVHVEGEIEATDPVDGQTVWLEMRQSPSGVQCLVRRDCEEGEALEDGYSQTHPPCREWTDCEEAGTSGRVYHDCGFIPTTHYADLDGDGAPERGELNIVGMCSAQAGAMYWYSPREQSPDVLQLTHILPRPPTR